MISWLKDEYQVTVVGAFKTSIAGVESIELFDGENPVEASIGARVFYYVQYAWNFLFRRFEEIVWSKLGRGRQVLAELSARNFDLIVSLDCTLLPFAFSLKRNLHSKILFDAREYYTRDFEEILLWRLFRKPVFQYLCNTYLKDCDRVITVSGGLSREYAREYGILPPEVVMSLPYAYPLTPSAMRHEHIHIIHHGTANVSRRTELMVAMMDHLDPRYTLDLMLVPTSDKAYWRKLETMVAKRRNVRIIPPVAMREIVPFINQYDIGLFLCPPANLNLEFVLPNKLFEFIQARLAVAIGPNIEMKRIVDQYGCGIVADDFESRTMAIALNALTAADVMDYKHQSHRAALELNADANRGRIGKLVQQMIS